MLQQCCLYRIYGVSTRLRFIAAKITPCKDNKFPLLSMYDHATLLGVTFWDTMYYVIVFLQTKGKNNWHTSICIYHNNISRMGVIQVFWCAHQFWWARWATCIIRYCHRQKETCRSYLVAVSLHVRSTQDENKMSARHYFTKELLEISKTLHWETEW